MKTIAIIGGGISGLAAAHHVKKYAKGQKEKIRVRVFEREDVLGGKIRTDSKEGFVIERGPDSVVSTKQQFIDMCEELGIAKDLIGQRPDGVGTSLFIKGKMNALPVGMAVAVPTKLTPMVTSSILSPLGKMRALIEVMVPRSGKPDESVESFIRRRFGHEVYNNLAEPLVSGVVAGNPNGTSIRHALPKLAEMEDQHRSLILAAYAKKKEPQASNGRPRFMSFKKGMGELIRALSASIGKENIALSTPIERITASKADPKRYVIRARNGKTITADAIISTIPAFVAADLLAEMDEGISATLKRIPYMSIATVSLAYDAKDVPSGVKGSGVIMPHREGMRMSAFTWSSLKWDGRAPSEKVLVRSYLNNSYSEGAPLPSDGELVAAARSELKSMTGIGAEPIFASAYRWTNGMPQYTLEHGRILDEIDRQLARHRGIFVTGAWRNGAGVPSCVCNAIAEAEKAVEYVAHIGD
jgi:oxygen-dependent protoporphyrinogen oxidase